MRPDANARDLMVTIPRRSGRGWDVLGPLGDLGFALPRELLEVCRVVYRKDLP